MITDYKGWPSAAEKSTGRPKPSAAIHRPPRGPPQNPVWFSTICTPLRDFRFVEGSQRFWKESPAHLGNLRNDTRILHSSAKTALGAHELAKLANFEKLAKLALQVCTLPATRNPSLPLRGRGVGLGAQRTLRGSGRPRIYLVST